MCPWAAFAQSHCLLFSFIPSSETTETIPRCSRIVFAIGFGCGPPSCQRSFHYLWRELRARGSLLVQKYCFTLVSILQSFVTSGYCWHPSGSGNISKGSGRVREVAELSPGCTQLLCWNLMIEAFIHFPVSLGSGPVYSFSWMSPPKGAMSVFIFSIIKKTS